MGEGDKQDRKQQSDMSTFVVLVPRFPRNEGESSASASSLERPARAIAPHWGRITIGTRIPPVNWAPRTPDPVLWPPLREMQGASCGAQGAPPPHPPHAPFRR